MNFSMKSLFVIICVVLSIPPAMLARAAGFANVLFSARSPQDSVADDGPGQPKWQVLVGFNLQFLG